MKCVSALVLSGLVTRIALYFFGSLMNCGEELREKSRGVSTAHQIVESRVCMHPLGGPHCSKRSNLWISNEVPSTRCVRNMNFPHLRSYIHSLLHLAGNIHALLRVVIALPSLSKD